MNKFLTRTILTFVLFIIVVSVSLYFCFAYGAIYVQVIGIVGAVLCAVLFGLLVDHYHRQLIVRPISHINYALRGLIKGDYKSRVDYNIVCDDYLAGLIGFTNQLASEFENIEEGRRSFVASASHELRSPLTSIQGFLQAILDGTIEKDEHEKYLQIVFNETRRLSSLTNNMLDLSRMESGKFRLDKTHFEINEVLKGVSTRFQPLLIKNDMTLNIKFAKDSVKVYADMGKIEQVVINLIDNAIKYSPHYTDINITTYIRGFKLYIVVQDHGFGISKKDQIFIWDKFYMADKARTPSKAKGTGLGLAIVKKIIDEHRELIWVESDIGHGSKFIFTLPVLEPQNTNKPFGGGSPRTAYANKEFGSGGTTNNMRN